MLLSITDAIAFYFNHDNLGLSATLREQPSTRLNLQPSTFNPIKPSTFNFQPSTFNPIKP
ncbi:MAG: hypothetical protein F6J90_30620 [Moorea sp. SIOASIH]|uniref:hypothetical protein n=1 Tax=Moorena sp. SIOASIH TaxID=2607817 RepID=UPI0013BD727B|nr:hypothetical protein [Moorena sp. SIOASIH]NEO40461.1 hypothetical protein [Moorena sp. SIOASIH]